MMSLHTFKGFVDCAMDAYFHAVEKHPVFTDKVTNHDIETVKVLLRARKNLNDASVKLGANPSFENLMDEEVLEYCEATLLGDTEAAKRELLDCAAVIMREWERINQ